MVSASQAMTVVVSFGRKGRRRADHVTKKRRQELGLHSPVGIASFTFIFICAYTVIHPAFRGKIAS